MSKWYIGYDGRSRAIPVWGESRDESRSFSAQEIVDRLNAMQAVVDAAKAARDTTKGHFIDMVGADAIFAALAGLEAK